MDNTLPLGRRNGQYLHEVEVDDRLYDPHDGYGSADLGDCTQITVIDDTVVDVRKFPVADTEFASTARDLGRGLPPPQPRYVPPPRPPDHERVLVWLSQVVGGDDVLESLDSVPLPEEDLDLTSVDQALRPRAQAVGAELARVTALILGTEARTAAYRLLGDALCREPSLLGGERAPAVMAAATLSAVAKANDLAGAGRSVPLGLINAMYDLTSARHDLARRIARTVAPQTVFVEPFRSARSGEMFLGSDRYLVSTFRAGIIAARDSALRLRAATPQE